jgi:hypothetical protein
MWMCEVGETASQDLLFFVDCLSGALHGLNHYSSLVSALATLVIGIFAVVQWRTLREQSRIGLLTQRMNCYLVYRGALDAFRGNPGFLPDSSYVNEFVRCELQSRFLFGPTVSASYRELGNLMVRIATLNQERSPGAVEHGGVTDREIERNRRRSQLLGEVDQIFLRHEKLFKPYLDVASVAVNEQH